MASQPATTATPLPDEARVPRVIEAIDLLGDAASRPLWRRGGRTTTLSRPGRPSPMGYLLIERYEFDNNGDLPKLCIQFGTRDAQPSREQPTENPPGLLERPSEMIRLKSTNAADGDLMLMIKPDRAHVTASPAAWEILAEPVLLAVCQYWRLACLDAQLDRLTESAETDIGHALASSRSTLRERARLLATAREVRALSLDLPHFMGPLMDPYPYCSSERSVQAYRSLAEKLHLDEWCEAIDARVEAVDETYAAVTDKLAEYRNFVRGAVLEVTIVAILLADLIFQIWQYLTAP